MVTRRTALAVTAGLTTLAASGLSLHAGWSSPAATPSAVQLVGASLASGAATHSAVQPAAVPTPAARPAGSERLDAVRTVQLFCDLVERGWLWRAGGLCSTTVWRRRELRALTRCTFLSARVGVAADPRGLTVIARVHVRPRSAAALRGAALHEGVNTLRFTLERVGTTGGGWLISAIATSPPTQERGPS